MPPGRFYFEHLIAAVPSVRHGAVGRLLLGSRLLLGQSGCGFGASVLFSAAGGDAAVRKRQEPAAGAAGFGAVALAGVAGLGFGSGAGFGAAAVASRFAGFGLSGAGATRCGKRSGGGGSMPPSRSGAGV